MTDISKEINRHDIQVVEVEPGLNAWKCVKCGRVGKDGEGRFEDDCPAGIEGTDEVESPPALACVNCFFAKDAEKTKHGVKVFACRRYPPQQTGSQQAPEHYPFPMVAATEWCGEHQPRPEPEEIPFGDKDGADAGESADITESAG